MRATIGSTAKRSPDPRNDVITNSARTDPSEGRRVERATSVSIDDQGAAVFGRWGRVERPLSPDNEHGRDGDPSRP